MDAPLLWEGDISSPGSSMWTFVSFVNKSKFIDEPREAWWGPDPLRINMGNSRNFARQFSTHIYDSISDPLPYYIWYIVVFCPHDEGLAEPREARRGPLSIYMDASSPSFPKLYRLPESGGTLIKHFENHCPKCNLKCWAMSIHSLSSLVFRSDCVSSVSLGGHYHKLWQAKRHPGGPITQIL